jgi:hypothetical protein
MSQNFRCKITEQELSILKQGLSILSTNAKNPFFHNQVALDEIDHLCAKIDDMATRYFDARKEIERNMAGRTTIGK